MEEAQLLTYMKLVGVRTSLLINFNLTKLNFGIKRFVLRPLRAPRVLPGKERPECAKRHTGGRSYLAPLTPGVIHVTTRKLSLFALHFILFSLALLIAGCAEDKSSPQTPKAHPVTTTTARMQPSGNQYQFSGKAKNSQETMLSFRVPGQIIRLPVQVGSRVEKDQLVAELDGEEYLLEVNRARARVRSIRSKKENLAKDFKRMQQLLRREAISQSRFDEVESGFESVSANLEEAEERLRIARKKLSYTRITAPDAGVISRLPVEKFQNVSAGRPVATFLSGNKTEVEVGIPDKLISSLSQGIKARVEFNALPENEYNATVTEIGMQPNPESTYPVTLVLNSPAPKVRPGMSALVQFNFKKTQKTAILLPLSAVAQEAYGPKYVWEVDPQSMKVRKKPVSTGAVSEDKVRILSGVEKGDIIVVRGVHRLRPGMRVKPIKADNF